MRNLKRALSLALAAIMVIGMMVIGAGAASITDFPDKDEIKNQDAVSLLTTLGIINGKDSGNFDPTGEVTRAEMAKMISVIMNNGVDNNELYSGMTTKLTDIATSWAKGHINFCYSRNIITGRGNNTFDPTANVTGAEAAKMLLVAAGYDPAVEGFTGASWSINVSALASALGIFQNFTANIMNPISRDDAALLIYNALDVEMIQKYEDGYAMEYKDSRTILSTMYGVYKIEGVVIQNEWAALDGTDKDFVTKEGKTVMSDVVVYESTTQNTTQGEGVAQKGNQTFNFETTADMLGKTVYLYAKKTTVLANSEVLGVYEKEGMNTIKETAGNVSDLKDYLKGTGLTTNKDTEYYVNYGVMEDFAASETYMRIDQYSRNGVEMDIIDNDNDGYVDYVLYMQEDLTSVTNINESKETMTFLSNSTDTTQLDSYEKGKSIDFADVIVEDGFDVAEDDIVLVRTYGGRFYVSQPEVITGKMESFSSNKTTEQYIKVDGEKYNPSYILSTAGGEIDDLYDFVVTQCDKDGGVQFDITYDFYRDTNGYIRAFRPTEETSSNYALIVDSGYNPGVYASDASGKVTALLADGTKATYSLNFDASATNMGKQLHDTDVSGTHIGDTDRRKTAGITELKGFLGTDYTDNSTSKPWDGATDDGKYGTPTIDYTFAYWNHNDDGVVPSVSDPMDYRAGMAKGFVITYSLDEDNVMTIKNIVGSATMQVDTNKGADVMGAVGSTNYKGGNATLYYSSNAQKLAIDKDTIAFYYLAATATDNAKYGVSTGYSKMADIDAGTAFQSRTVAKTGGKLADMVIFNAEGAEAAKDYAFVLGRNYTGTSGNYVEVTAILENGEASILKLKRSNFDNYFDDSTDFYKAYAYNTNADGITTIEDTDGNDRVVGSYATKLKNGTVTMSTSVANANASIGNYYSYDETSKIWDVTDLSDETENAKTGTFAENKPKHAVIVVDSKDKVRVAFVWAIDPDDEDPLPPSDELMVRYNKQSGEVEVYNPKNDNSLTISQEVTKVLEKEGFTDIEFNTPLNASITAMTDVNAKLNGTKYLGIKVEQVFAVKYGTSTSYVKSAGTATFNVGTGAEKFVVNADVSTNGTGAVAGVGTIAYSSNTVSFTTTANDGSGNAANPRTYTIRDAYQVAAQTNVTVYTDEACTTAINNAHYYAVDTVLYVKADATYALTDATVAILTATNTTGVYGFKLTGNVAAGTYTSALLVTVSYVAGAEGSGVPANASVVTGGKYVVGAAPVATDTHIFVGYLATVNNTGLYQPGDEIATVDGAITMTAVYLSKTVTATSNKDAGGIAAAGIKFTTTADIASSVTAVAAKGTITSAVPGTPTVIDATGTASGNATIAAAFTAGTNYDATLANAATGETIDFTLTVTYGDAGTATYTVTYVYPV